MSVLAGFATIWLLIAVGYLIKLKGVLSEDDAKKLSSFIFWLPLPALMFSAMYGVEDFSKVYLLFVGGIVVSLVIAVVAYPSIKLLKPEKPLAGSFFITSVLQNAGFLGLPMMFALYGQAGLEAAAVYMLSGVIVSATLINWASACYAQGTCGYGEMLKRIVLFPLFIAFVLGLAANYSGLTIPAVLMNVVDAVGGITIPLILIAIGVLFRFQKPKHLGKISLVGFFRFIFAPVVAYVFGTAVGLSGILFKVLVLESAMPPAIANIVYSVERKLDLEFTENAIFVLTLISMAVIPAIAWVLG